MKSLTCSIRLIKPLQRTNAVVYTFSKKLKHKILNEQKNDPLIETVPPINPPSEHIGKATQREQRKMSMQIKFGAPTLMLLSCTLFSSQLFTFFNIYKYSLFGLQKFVSFLVLTNITYPKNQYFKYAIIGSVVATNFIPLLNIYSPLTQVLQLVLVLSHDSKKVREDIQLTEEQRIVMADRIRIKLGLYFFLASIILFKLLYHYRCFEMDKIINELNMINRGEPLPAPEKQMNLFVTS